MDAAKHTLLLDRNYMVLAIIDWKKAIKLTVKGKAEPLNYYNTKIKSGSGEIGIPSILRLVIIVPWRAHMGRTRFSRKNIMLRDSYKCQYCGSALSRSAGTIDHIIPKSMGGITDYTNCVACCKRCNGTKGNKTLEESGLVLSTKPRKPNIIMLYKNIIEKAPEEWMNYMVGV